MKMQYTEEQIARANHTDLVSFLNEQGEQLVKSGREYRWKKHDSVTVSGNRWYRHSQSAGEGDRCYLSYGTYHPRVGRGSLAAFYRQDRTDSACFLGLSLIHIYEVEYN